MRIVARSLAVLQAMNATAGPHSILSLSKDTGISRPALYRILHTLAELGYVRLDERNAGYQLTHHVRALSAGFDEEHWVTDIASPVLEALQRKVVWPTDLATYSNGAMHLRQTTRRLSPWTIDRAAIGLRLPMLGSATGRAYLAFCRSAEQRGIMALLKQTEPAEKLGAVEHLEMEKIIEWTRVTGYGERVGGAVPDSSAIAVPVYDERGVRGCISITFISSVLTPAQAAERYIEHLLDSSAQISRKLTE